MRNAVILFHILFLFSSTIGTAQSSPIDSVLYFLNKKPLDTTAIKCLNDLNAKVMFSGQVDTATYYQRIILKEAQKLNFIKGQAKANNLLGVSFYYKSMPDSALVYYKKALELNKKINYHKGIGAAYDNLAMILVNKGEFAEALEYQLKGLQMQEEMNEKTGILLSLVGIANVYSNMGNFKQSNAYYEKALAKCREFRDERYLSSIYCRTGINYSQLKDLPRAISNYRLAIQKAEEGHNANDLIFAYNNMGNVYLVENYPDSAIKYYGLAKDLINYTDNLDAIATTCVNYGALLISQKKFAEAESYVKKALEILTRLGDKRGLAEVYGELSDISANRMDFKNAYSYMRMRGSLKDSMVNESVQKKIGELQLLFEREKKNKEIQLLQRDKDLQTAISEGEKKKKNIILFSGIVIVVMLGIFIGFIVNRFNVTRKQKNIIEEQKSEVEGQKHLIEEKQKEILDSISYAKRLQDAIIPSVGLVKQHLPDSFVLYKPKDIVAGDFYWMEKIKDSILFAAADCTGHGVPGAMVSIVCSNALHRAVKEFGLVEPGEILDKVRMLVLETFEKSESVVKDGMDISLASICFKNNRALVKWSGANNPLWYMAKGELKEITAHKQPIGETENPVNFPNHTLELDKGDILYLFTDGYPDQFGGPKGKKFKYKQLEELLLRVSSRPMEEQLTALNQGFENWRGSLEQIDDVTIIGIRL